MLQMKKHKINLIVLVLYLTFGCFAGNLYAQKSLSDFVGDTPLFKLHSTKPHIAKHKKSFFSKTGLIGAAAAGTIVAISGLPALSIAAGAAIGYGAAVLTKKLVTSTKNHFGSNDAATKLIPPLNKIDSAKAAQESARCAEFLAKLNGKQISSASENFSNSLTVSQTPAQNFSEKYQTKMFKTKQEAYKAYQKAYKAYMNAVETANAKLAKEKAKLYKKYYEIYKNF